MHQRLVGWSQWGSSLSQQQNCKDEDQDERDAIQNLAPPHGFGLPAITMLRCQREWRVEEVLGVTFDYAQNPLIWDIG
jgi:hypothetical protein